MALPGKLTIGYVHEDNPVKFYFRFRPLVSLSETGFEPTDESISAQYPEDGFIRIVPDKNEISQFKTRMRQLGRYCLLDLRRHPNENDKIRPNKNYVPDGAERNAFIVYSDVIGAISCEMALEVLDATGVFDADVITLRASTPGTRFVALRREDRLSGPWAWTETPEIPGCISLSIAPGFVRADVALEDARIIEVETPEGTFPLMYNPAVLGLTAPVPEVEKHVPREGAPLEAQAAPAHAHHPIPAQTPAPQVQPAYQPSAQAAAQTSYAAQPAYSAPPAYSAQPTYAPPPAVEPAPVVTIEPEEQADLYAPAPRVEPPPAPVAAAPEPQIVRPTTTRIVDPAVAEDEEDEPLFGDAAYEDRRPQQRGGFLSLFGSRPRYEPAPAAPRSAARGGALPVETPDLDAADSGEDLEIPSFLRRLAN